jgi:hypothetical protein
MPPVHLAWPSYLSFGLRMWGKAAILVWDLRAQGSLKAAPVQHLVCVFAVVCRRQSLVLKGKPVVCQLVEVVGGL